MLPASILIAASTLYGQDVSPPAAAPHVTWRASAGFNTFALRDVARTGPPVDGSPVRWVGSGPAIVLDYERARPDRTHRIETLFSTDGDFEYDTSISRLARPAAEAVRQFVARYEYVRYPRKLTVAGLSFGIGVAGGGEAWTLDREASSVADRETGRSGDVASIIAARTRWWDRLAIDASWLNALRLLHVDLRHTNQDASVAFWGGGWSSEWSAHAGVRVSGRARLHVTYTGIGYGTIASHRNYTVEGRRLTIGASYER